MRFLVETQAPDGSWDEPFFTGTGFPGRLLPQLPPLSFGLPGDGARTDRLGSEAADERSELLVSRRCGSRQPALGRAVRGTHACSAPAWAPTGAHRRGARARRSKPAAWRWPVSAPASVPEPRRRRRRLRAPSCVATGGDPIAVPGKRAARRRAAAPRPARRTSGRSSRVDRGRRAGRAPLRSPAAARSRSTWSRPGSPTAPTGARSPCCASSSTRPAAQLADPRTRDRRHPRALRALRRAAPALAEWARAVGAADACCSPARARSAPASTARSRSSSWRSRSAARPSTCASRSSTTSMSSPTWSARGAIFVEELDEVPDGATVVFSAHGVSPAVRADAAGAQARRDRRDLPARQQGARRGAPLRRGGQDDLPDRPRGPRGGRGHRRRGARRDPCSSRTSRQAERVEAPDPERVAYLTQTTLAVDETDEIVAALRERFPALRGPGLGRHLLRDREPPARPCARSRARPTSCSSSARETSSNSQRLVEVAQREGARAYLVDDETDVDVAWLDGAGDGRRSPPARRRPSGSSTSLVAALAALGADRRRGADTDHRDRCGSGFPGGCGSMSVPLTPERRRRRST